MDTIGHGAREDITAEAALEIAKTRAPSTQEQADPNDPQGLALGQRVGVAADDYGKDPVDGSIVALSPQHITIARRDDKLGDIHVHFPRVGFAVTPI